jgi:peroxiredoxin
VATGDDFELPDQEGRPWRLADALARGPVLLVFFRGDW